MSTLDKIKKTISKREWFLLSYLVIHMCWYFFVEALNTGNDYVTIYCTFDDYVPFCEWFLIPYISWFPYMVFTGLFFLLKDKEAFEKYLLSMWSGFFVCLVICTLVSTGQNLRPETMPRDNILTYFVSLIYDFDTNTNVFPSMHVVGALAAGVAIANSKMLKSKKGLQIFNVVLCISIILSTVFMNQHSVLDVFGALVLEMPICILAQKGTLSNWFDKLTKTKRSWTEEKEFISL